MLAVVVASPSPLPVVPWTSRSVVAVGHHIRKCRWDITSGSGGGGTSHPEVVVVGHHIRKWWWWDITSGSGG
eukprot:3720491-Prymnesium_polylepis.1